jgi:hypothetical protein
VSARVRKASQAKGKQDRQRVTEKTIRD